MEGSVDDDNYNKIVEIIKKYNPKGYSIEKAHHEFEAGGRWSNFESNVYEIKCNEDVAFFELVEEVPASEVQDGMDLSYDFWEVEPKEVTTVIYVVKRSAKEV